MKYANFTDDHVPSPSTHAPRTHVFQDAGSGPKARFLVAAFDDRDAVQADGRWLACPKADSVPVEP